MVQHHIPIIGKQGFTASAPYMPGNDQPSYLRRTNPRGQREGFYLLLMLNGGMVYVSENKSAGWAERQLLKRQIVPFNPMKMLHVTMEAATAQFDDTLAKVRDRVGDVISLMQERKPKVPPTDDPGAAEWVRQTEVKPQINRIHQTDVDTFRFLNDHSVEFNSLDRYQEIATGSAIYPGQGTPFGLMYAALGLAEAGEVQNKVKKAFRDDGVIMFGHDEEFVRVKFGEISAERRAQIIKELGGNLWYIAAVCNEIGAELSEVALANLEELLGRTERGTLSGSGDNR